MYLAISALFLLLVIGLAMLSHKMKLPIEHRVLHIRSVLMTLAFDIAVVCLFVRILDLLDMFLGITAVRNALFRIMPQTNVSAAFFWIVTLLSCLFVCIAYCLVLWAVYTFWLRRMSKKAYLRKKNILTKLFTRLSAFFYEVEGNPEVKKLWANVGRWLRYMRNVFSVGIIAEAIVIPVYLQAELTLINDFTFSAGVKSLYMVPVLTWFLLDQVVIFLQADLGSEDILLETEESRLSHFGDYKKLIAIYDDAFGGQALISYYVNEPSMEKELFSGATDEQKKRAENPELLEAICRSVNNLVNPLPPNFIDALVDLINGKSIAVFDSLSGEFQLFYLAYLQRELYLRRKALVVCDTDDQVRAVISEFRDIFKKINKSHEIWKISDIGSLLRESDADPHVLICTEEELIKYNLEESNAGFCRDIHDVFVIHAYDIMCRPNPFSFRFFSSLQKSNAQFVFLLPENNRDIDSSLEIRLNGADICLYDNYNEEAGACILCWRAESYYKTQQALSMDLYHDFGLAYTIASIAVANGVSNIYMHMPENVPYRTYAAAINAYSNILAKRYFHKESISMDSFVICNPIVAFRNKDLSFDIFYDEYNNLLNVVMQALSNCAELTSMVHIVSRPYMLRDYFADHLDKLVRNDKGMQLIVPVFYQELQAPSVALLILLREKGMTIEDIIDYMAQFGVTGKNVEEVLLLAIRSAFGEDKFQHVYSYFTFGDGEKTEFYDDQYHYTRLIKLTNETIYEKACALTENNVVVTGAHEEVLPFARSSVYNRFLPGQCHSFGGERFEILSIENGKLEVRSEETLEREKEYTAIYDIPVAMMAETPTLVWNHNEKYSRELFPITVKRSIRGYFSHTNGLDFYGDNIKRCIWETPIEETKNVYALRLKLKFPFNAHHDTAAALLVMLMRGLLESAVPKNYQDILVVSRLDKEGFDETLFDDAPANAIRKDPIPHDWLIADDNELPLCQELKDLFQSFGETNLELNTENEINLYLIDFSSNGMHVLAGIAEETTRLFNVLFGYLDWVIKNPHLKHCYLRFGYHQIPGIFNLSVVYSCLEQIAQYAPNVSGGLHGKLVSFDLTQNVHCSFCGRSIAVSHWQFDDDRIMCEDCYKHRATERREIQVLLKQAYETLESTYGIKLPEGIKIKFKSAASIRKASGVSAGGRVLGFYHFGRREIWVERGGPEPCVLSTLMHELTHAWQHANIDVDNIELKYLEGHSTYVEIECTRRLGQPVYADFWERSVLAGSDEYAQGLRYWKDRLKIESDKNIFHHMAQM